MNQSTAKYTLIASGLYILSQVILVFTFGKDIELILLSFGVFVASIVLLFSFQSFSPGRVNLESVSMRRASATKDVQDDMLEKGYAIDDEFLSKNPLRTFTRKKSSGFEYTRHHEDQSIPEPKSIEHQKSLESQILAGASMYGGLEKMKTMADKMDNKTIEKMAKQMGFHMHTASELRSVLENLIDKERKSSNGKSAQMDLDCRADCHPKVSLDPNSFNDYIKRCMSGEQENYLNDHGIEFIDEPAPTDTQIKEKTVKNQPDNGVPARVLKRMRGIRASSGGKMKCDNCSNFDRVNSMCGNANLEVEITDVCDAWQPFGAIG